MRRRDRIHICYAIHDTQGSYSKYTGTSICSVLENTQNPITLHILHDDTLNERNRKCLVQLAEYYSAELHFYNVAELVPEKIAFLADTLQDFHTMRFSPAALYRLLTPELLPVDIDKVIYLDSDTIIHMDITELWQEQAGANGIAAIAEVTATMDCPAPQYLVQAGLVPQKCYFNSGVLLLDLAKLRQVRQLLEGGVAFLQQCPECFCYDQDILNFFFSDNYRRLPQKYNDFVVSERREGQQLIKPHIYHYAGKAVDVLDLQDVYNQLFCQYFTKTPWYDTQFFMNMMNTMRDAYEKRKKTLRELLDTGTGSRRCFYGSEAQRQLIAKMFQQKDGDNYQVIVSPDGQLDVRNLLNIMRQWPADYIHIFLVDVFDALCPYFQEAGYQPGKNVLDGRQFLASSDGGWAISGVDLFDAL